MKTMEEAVRKLRINLQDLHYKTCVDGVDQSQLPYEDRSEDLRALAKIFLDFVEPSKRLDSVIQSILLENSQNIPSWKAVSALMFTMERYAINLLIYPWKTEYHKITTCSGFYKTKLENVLPSGAIENLFSILNYQKSAHFLILKSLLEHRKLRILALEFYLAAIECENYEGVFATFCTQGMTNVNAMKLRNKCEGSLWNCYNTMDKIYLQTDETQSSACNSLSLVTDSPSLEGQKVDTQMPHETHSCSRKCPQMFEDNVERSKMPNECSGYALPKQQLRKEKAVKKQYLTSNADCMVSNAVDRKCCDDPSKFPQNHTSSEQRSDSELLKASQRFPSKILTCTNIDSPSSELPESDMCDGNDAHWNSSIPASVAASTELGDRRSCKSISSTHHRNLTTNASSSTKTLRGTLGNREIHPLQTFNEYSEKRLKNCTLNQQGGQQIACSKDKLATLQHDMITDSYKGEKVEQKWQCTTCTYVNRPSSTICDVCSKSCDFSEDEKLPEAGGKECSKCTFINSGSARVCRICQNDLQGSSIYV